MNRLVVHIGSFRAIDKNQQRNRGICLVTESSVRPETADSGSSWHCSSDELGDTTSGLDASDGDLGEHLGTNDARSRWELSLAENFHEALQTNRLLINKKRTYSLGNIDNSCFLFSRCLTSLLGHESPEFVEVDCWAVVLVFLIVEMSLSFLSVVSWMTTHKRKSELNTRNLENAPLRDRQIRVVALTI